MKGSRRGREAVLAGVGVSPGVARGNALVLRDDDEAAVEFRSIPARGIRHEAARLEHAFDGAIAEIRQLKERVSSEVGLDRSKIFDAQMFMLADDQLRGEAIRRVQRERVNAEWALRETRDSLVRKFQGIPAEIIQEKAADIRDVTRRVHRCLQGERDQPEARSATGSVILVATEITPSEAAVTDTTSVRAFVIETGGRTSHTAILAKALGIPAIVGVADATARIETGAPLLVDGGTGQVLVNPDESAVKERERRERNRAKHDKVLRRDRSKLGQTKDGRRVFVQANIELPDEVDAALAKGAEGIGLYRTEFLYLSQQDGHEPDEDEHYAVYKAIAARVKPSSAIIRTLDLGGDKLLSTGDGKTEDFHGLRALRLCLAHPAMFRVQLRALLRASVHGRLKVMFPFVTAVEELRAAKALLRECQSELQAEGKRFNESLELGAMIEVPAAALSVDLLAREVSFFSIGTNDLMQFLLALDRRESGVSPLYEPLHPAVLRLLDTIVSDAHRAGVRVGMCGEIAADPLLTPFLVGLGLDELSMAPHNIPAVKYTLRHLEYESCTRLARDVLGLKSPASIRRRLLDYVGKRVPEWLVSEATPGKGKPRRARKPRRAS